MKITSIKQQVKLTNRYSVYIDGAYSFSLSETALIETKISSGKELDSDQLESYKKLSADDKLYNRALRYVAMRQRSVWEATDYLKRKGAAPEAIEYCIAKLLDLRLLDDFAYARSFVRDRRLLRSSSKRKLLMELRKKRVDSAAIDAALAEDETDDTSAIRQLIGKKRRQLKYQDNDKLMQYLARQGFSYGDIKTALSANDEY